MVLGATLCGCEQEPLFQTQDRTTYTIMARVTGDGEPWFFVDEAATLTCLGFADVVCGPGVSTPPVCRGSDAGSAAARDDTEDPEIFYDCLPPDAAARWALWRPPYAEGCDASLGSTLCVGGYRLKGAHGLVLDLEPGPDGRVAVRQLGQDAEAAGAGSARGCCAFGTWMGEAATGFVQVTRTWRVFEDGRAETYHVVRKTGVFALHLPSGVSVEAGMFFPTSDVP